jgi:hypothetical protein
VGSAFLPPTSCCLNANLGSLGLLFSSLCFSFLYQVNLHKDNFRVLDTFSFDLFCSTGNSKSLIIKQKYHTYIYIYIYIYIKGVFILFHSFYFSTIKKIRETHMHCKKYFLKNNKVKRVGDDIYDS